MFFPLIRSYAVTEGNLFSRLKIEFMIQRAPTTCVCRILIQKVKVAALRGIIGPREKYIDIY